jgi:hypothetical protein
MSKKNLPEKVCPVCKRRLTWRKKWERDKQYLFYLNHRFKNDPKR